MRLPIRWRLTLWYAGFLALVLTLVGGALFVALRHRLHEGLAEQLAAQAEIARVAVGIEGDGPGLGQDVALLDDDATIRLFAPNGTVAGEHGASPDNLPLAPEAVAAARDGETTTTAVETDDGTRWVRTAPILVDGAVRGVLQVALPSDDVEETLDDLVSLLVIAAPIVLVAAVGGGYLLAGRALSPVVTISTLAARIDEHDLDARLGLDLPDDELGRLAATFDGMLARIEQAFARQRQFTGDAAHELRTPLGLMRSQIDLALARPRSAHAYREALEGLDADLGRMSQLVETLLTLARADAGQLLPDRAVFDLGDTIATVLDDVRSRAAPAGVELVNQASPTPLEADESLLIQVLLNLVDNALAHTPPGGTISAGCRAEGDAVRLWVTDTGSGIATGHRERVFDRFYRVDPGRARQQGGTGLGLAIVRAIAEIHGGTAALVPQDGPGTRIELVLPNAPHPPRSS